MSKRRVQKLTKAFCDKAECQEKDGKPVQTPFWDSEIKGFALRVSPGGAKSFVFQRDIGGKTVSQTIGRYGDLTLEEARKLAKLRAASFAQGINPVELSREEKAKNITLREALEEMLLVRARQKRSPRTLARYRHSIEKYLPDLLDRSLKTVTKAEIRARHRKLADDVSKGVFAEAKGQGYAHKRNENHGAYTADEAVRVFRTVFEYAKDTYDYLPENPVRKHPWFVSFTKRRESFISSEQMPLWYGDIMNTPNEIKRDCLLFLLFTGLRKTNALESRWVDVNFEKKYIAIPKPKSQRPFELPLSRFLIDLLLNRKRENEILHPGSPWIFPSDSASGHLIDPRKDKPAIPFMIHDLRRTFVTHAERVAPKHVVALLVNHAVDGNITSRYWHAEFDHMAQHMETISRYLLSLCKPETADNVVPIRNLAN